MRCLILLTISLGLLALPVASQCASVVNVPSGDPTTGTNNVIPFGQSATYSAGYTYVGEIPAANMDPVNVYVQDISFAPSGNGNWSCGTVIIALGHVSGAFPNPFNFPTFDASGNVTGIGSYSDLTVVYNSFNQGPFSWNLIQNSWSPMGFAGTGGTGFVWNGVDNVAFFVTYLSSTVTGFTGSFHRDFLIRAYGSGYNIPVATSNASAAALKIQLAVTQGPGLPAVPVWQCNQPSSSADVNGASDPGTLVPMTTTVGTGTAVNLNFGGLGGFPFDLAVTAPEPGVPVGGGGILTGSGYQAINIDLTATSLFLLFGGTFTNSFAPYSVPVASAIPLSVSFQQVVIDPANIDGFALSHLNELSWVPCSASENFDSLALGLMNSAIGNVPIGWTSPSGGAATWTVDAAGTPSTATGPTSAFNGANYLYCETSGFTNTTFAFDTCAEDATGLSTFTLSFEVSAIGATIGTLNVYQGDGSGAFAVTPIYTQTGADPNQSQGGIEWTNVTIPLLVQTPFVNFRFEYISGTSFTGDLALDDIQLN